jgi:hypothetical protein
MRYLLRKFSTLSKRESNQRIAVGTNKLSMHQPDGTYPSVLATAIQNNVDTFETTLHKEEEMRRGMTDAIMYLQSHGNQIADRSIKVMGKIGYRTASDKLSGDILQEQQSGDVSVFHNFSKAYIEETVTKSPLTELFRDRKEVDLVFLAHNPEAQGAELVSKGAPTDDVRLYVKEQMLNTFVAMETMAGEGKIGSFGVCSNGLSLPSKHPLHLFWEDIFSSAAEAVQLVHGHESDIRSNLSTIQLPANLLETNGLKVANQIKQYLAASRNNKNRPNNIQIHVTRPLTCYPHGGSGTGHPFKLVDYMIPTSEDGSDLQWTHLLKKTPSYYSSILNETMSHFDASHLIDIKTSGERQLTTEERETLDGCKLLSSMIHDLDLKVATGQVRSFAAYEEDLYTKIVPLIHDTFEELDEESADLLQRFFRAHGDAIRLSIAKVTR